MSPSNWHLNKTCSKRDPSFLNIVSVSLKKSLYVMEKLKPTRFSSESYDKYRLALRFGS